MLRHSKSTTYVGSHKVSGVGSEPGTAYSRILPPPLFSHLQQHPLSHCVLSLGSHTSVLSAFQALSYAIFLKSLTVEQPPLSFAHSGELTTCPSSSSASASKAIFSRSCGFVEKSPGSHTSRSMLPARHRGPCHR